MDLVLNLIGIIAQKAARVLHHESFFENHLSRITIPRSSINDRESPNPGSSIDSRTLRIITRVSVPTLFRVGLSTSNPPDWRSQRFQNARNVTVEGAQGVVRANRVRTVDTRRTRSASDRTATEPYQEVCLGLAEMKNSSCG